MKKRDYRRENQQRTRPITSFTLGPYARETLNRVAGECEIPQSRLVEQLIIEFAETWEKERAA